MIEFLVKTKNSMSPRHRGSINISLDSSSAGILRLAPPAVFGKHILTSTNIPKIVAEVKVFL